MGVSDDIDEGIAQAFTEDSEDLQLQIGIDIGIAVTGKDDDDDAVADVVDGDDDDVDDWAKGIVYEGEEIDICGSNNEHDKTRIISNDDPIPLNACSAPTMGSPTKQPLSQSLSPLQLQQRVQRVQQQQQQQQQIHQLQQLQRLQQVQKQQLQQRRFQQAQQQQQQQFTHIPPTIGVVPSSLQ